MPTNEELLAMGLEFRWIRQSTRSLPTKLSPHWLLNYVQVQDVGFLHILVALLILTINVLFVFLLKERNRNQLYKSHVCVFP